MGSKCMRELLLRLYSFSPLMLSITALLDWILEYMTFRNARAARKGKYSKSNSGCLQFWYLCLLLRLLLLQLQDYPNILVRPTIIPFIVNPLPFCAQLLVAGKAQSAPQTIMQICSQVDYGDVVVHDPGLSPKV